MKTLPDEPRTAGFGLKSHRAPPHCGATRLMDRIDRWPRIFVVETLRRVRAALECARWSSAGASRRITTVVAVSVANKGRRDAPRRGRAQRSTRFTARSNRRGDGRTAGEICIGPQRPPHERVSSQTDLSSRGMSLSALLVRVLAGKKHRRSRHQMRVCVTESATCATCLQSPSAPSNTTVATEREGSVTAFCIASAPSAEVRSMSPAVRKALEPLATKPLVASATVWA
jgi:hypothetical protein